MSTLMLLFKDVMEGEAPIVQFAVNEIQYNMGYFLTYGIYLDWTTLVKTILRPQGHKRKLFTQYQEATRKDRI